MNNTPTQSRLCDLPPPLFGIVCDYLDLEFKCRSLHVLCKAAKTLFQPALCCRGHLSIIYKDPDFPINENDPVDQERFVHNQCRLDLIPYALSIHCEIKDPQLYTLMPSLRKHIFDMLVAAIERTRLQSVTLSDIVLLGIPNIAFPLIERLNHLKPEQLTGLRKLELKLSCNGFDDSDDDYWEDVFNSWHCSVDWSGLSSWHSLQHFSFSPPRLYDADRFAGPILDSLPNSLKSLSLVSAQFFVARLNNKLKDPNWLPFMRALHNLQDPEMYDNDKMYLEPFHQDLFPNLATVMTNTNQPRPIEHLRLNSVPGMDLRWCNELCSLEVKREEHAQLPDFVWLDDGCIPKLHDLTVEVHSKDYEILDDYPCANKSYCDDVDFATSLPLYHKPGFDVAPIVSFASKRPIQFLCLREAWPSDRIRFKMSDDAFQLLGGMHDLKRLDLSLQSKYTLSRTYVIPSDAELPRGCCWPEMRELNLTGKVCSIRTCMSMLRASPGLTLLSLSTIDSSLTFLRFFVHSCPQITSINDDPQFATGWYTEVGLDAVEMAFDAFPISRNHLQCLRHLHLRTFKLGSVDPQVHHFICTHLADHASELTDYPLLSIDARMTHVEHHFAPFTLYVHCRVKCLPPTHGCDLWIKILSPLSHRFSDQQTETDTGLFASDGRGNFRFRTLLNDPPLDGCTSFAAELYSLLTDRDKQTLQRWDAGDYSTRLLPRHTPE